jgi:hypothetical protein
MRVIVAALALVVSLLVTATAAFFAVMFLAGPHGGALPASLHSATLLVAWVIVMAVPFFCTRWVWRRYRRPPRWAR